MNSSLYNFVFTNDPAILDQIMGLSDDEKRVRLSVYRNNIFYSLSTALREIFPVTHQLCGEDYFYRIAHRYLISNPPQSPELHHYGEHFAQLLAEQPSHQSHPYLAEIANLEYQLVHTTHMTRTPTLSPQSLAAELTTIPNIAKTYWKIDPAAQLITSAFNLPDIYAAHAQNALDRLSTLDWNQPSYLLIAKNALRFGEIYPLTQTEAQLIMHLQQGDLLEHACANLKDNDSMVVFSRLIHLPIITAIVSGQEEPS